MLAYYSHCVLRDTGTKEAEEDIVVGNEDYKKRDRIWKISDWLRRAREERNRDGRQSEFNFLFAGQVIPFNRQLTC